MAVEKVISSVKGLFGGGAIPEGSIVRMKPRAGAVIPQMISGGKGQDFFPIDGNEKVNFQVLGEIPSSCPGHYRLGGSLNTETGAISPYTDRGAYLYTDDRSWINFTLTPVHKRNLVVVDRAKQG